VIPILGCRTVEQLEDNLGTLSVEVPNDVLGRLDEASRIDPGFPHDFLSAGFTANMIHGNVADRIRTGNDGRTTADTRLAVASRTR
jgi:hypothetical protein